VAMCVVRIRFQCVVLGVLEGNVYFCTF